MHSMIKKLSFVLPALLVLQSCYTLLHPPETLPQTVTTTTAEPVLAATLGGPGFYGWDPYWEPALPFTSYNRGYGASYYSPYNYYDYRDPYYAPVYVVHETPDPRPGRNYERDDPQGGTRVREQNPASTALGNAGSGSGSTSVGNGMSTAVPVVAAPPVTDPVVIQPVKPQHPRERHSSAAQREVKQVVIKQPRPPRKSVDSSKTDSDAPRKRVRTRK